LRKLLLLCLILFLIAGCIGCIPSPRFAYLQDIRGGSRPKSSDTPTDIYGRTSGYVPPPDERSFADQQRDAREEFNRTGQHEMTGVASWYGPGFHGRQTANGETFNENAMTAAHKTLPFNTNVRVTDLETGRSVVVRINDRGPYAKGRIIDLSKRAAERLGMRERGHANVRLDIVR